MGTTAKVIVSGKVTGQLEGGSAQFSYSQTNSTAVYETFETSAGVGIANASSFSNPTDARMLIINPPSTNTAGYRMSPTTAEVGLPMSSQGAALFTIPPSTTPNVYHVYTTSTRAIVGMRVRFH